VGKQRVFRAVVVPFVLFVFPALAAPSDPDAVKKAVAGFATAWNRHDPSAFAQLFDDNADFENAAGARWTGRQQIETNFAWRHGAVPANEAGSLPPASYGTQKATVIRFVQTDVRFLRKDVAIAYVDWELSDEANADAGLRHGSFLFVLAEQHGAWLIETLQNQEANSEALRRRLERTATPSR
jgi:hypothetical protein